MQTPMKGKNMRHIVLIRMTDGTEMIRPNRIEQVARAMKNREDAGRVVTGVECSASCPCGGSWGETS